MGETCPSNCKLEYELPNSFDAEWWRQKRPIHFPRTNSGDQSKIRVFNRWGELLFQTEDPALLGMKRTNKKKEISDEPGTFAFQIIRVSENSGQVVEDRKGFIEIIHWDVYWNNWD